MALVWNPDVYCECSLGLHRASVRAEWNAQHLGMPEEEAKQTVMKAFPLMFQQRKLIWNPDVFCKCPSGIHRASGRVQWCCTHLKMTQEEAESVVMLEFPLMFEERELVWDPDVYCSTPTGRHKAGFCAWFNTFSRGISWEQAQQRIMREFPTSFSTKVSPASRSDGQKNQKATQDQKHSVEKVSDALETGAVGALQDCMWCALPCGHRIDLKVFFPYNSRADCSVGPCLLSPSCTCCVVICSTKYAISSA
jgi:hypothetical protein